MRKLYEALMNLASVHAILTIRFVLDNCHWFSALCK